MTRPLILALAAGLTLFAGIANAATDLYVGFNGSNQTNQITNFTHNNNNCFVGFNAGDSNNLLEVDNSGTVLTLILNLYDGYNGSSNSVVISNGGKITDNYTYIGNSSTSSNNSILITGNSLLTSATFTLGQLGSGNSMVISNGGRVLDTTGNAGGAGSGNSALVTGSGSLWSNAATFSVGFFGSSNSMVISNGGQVLDANGIIGYKTNSANNASQNSVLVTGSGSLWSNTSTLQVGVAGSGTLTLANGGVVSSTGITIAASNNSSGTLNIGSYGGSDAAGTNTAPTIAFGSGTGTINFNQTNTTTLTSSISGIGTVQQLGSGTTILTSSNSYTGTTLITNGTLLANNTAGSALGTSSVLVTNSGTLGGNGLIGGATTNASGGNLIPGLVGSGTLTFTNGLTLQGGSTTTLQINSTNSFTSINLNGGAVNYGGTLTFNLTSYAPLAVAGDTLTLFDFTNGATESGDFTAVNAIGDAITFTDLSGTWTGTDSYGLTYELNDFTGVLTVIAAVPEPSSYGLFGIGAMALVVAHRRVISKKNSA